MRVWLALLAVGCYSPDIGGDRPCALVAISAGGAHTCALRADGTLYCWGLNDSGEVGVPPSEPILEPTPVEGIPRVASIDAGGYFTCAVTTSGEVWCFGANDHFQLGDADALMVGPTRVAGIPPMRFVGAGFQHACGLSTGGEVYCWGADLEGETGQGMVSDFRNPPVLVPLPAPAADLAVGFRFNCALVGDYLRCWGVNDNNQLGPVVTEPASPNLVPGLLARHVIAGGHHACAVERDTGSAWCWGANTYGELAAAVPSPYDTPTETLFPGRVGVITAGHDFSCVIDDTGRALCAGDNRYGQRGDGTLGASSYSTPTPVATTEELVTIDGSQSLDTNVSPVPGGAHACAITTTGVALCWGRGAEGQLGDGVGTDQLTPTPIVVPSCP